MKSKRAQLFVFFTSIMALYLWGAYSGVFKGDSLNYWSDLFWTGVSFLAGVRCLRTAQKASNKKLRTAWNMFGLAAFSWFFGMLIWDYYEVFAKNLIPFPSLSDWFFMGYAVFFAIGLFQYRLERPLRDYKYIQVANLGLIVCGVAILCYLILSKPLYLSENVFLYEFYALLHSQLTVFCFVFGAYCYFFFVWHENKSSFQVLLVALFIMAGTDTLYTFQLLGQSYEATSYLNVYWLLSFALQYWAAFEQEYAITAEPSPQDAPGSNSLEKVEAVMPAALIVIILITCLLLSESINHESVPILVLSGIVFSIFLGARAWFSSRLEASLQEDLVNDISQRIEAEENLRWEVQLNEELAKLSNTLIAPIEHIEHVAKIVLESARFLTKSTHGFVSEIDTLTANNVVLTVTKMMDDSLVITEPGQKISFSPNKHGKYSALWGCALNTGKSFFTNDVQTHPSTSGVPDGHIQVKQFLTVPVKYHEEIIGQIALANPHADYTESHLEAIKRLADLYALSLHRQRATVERNQLAETAVRSSQLATLGELAAGVAHEINNPITGVINYAQIIINKACNDSQCVDLASRIIKEGDRIASIVTKLLAFARKEEGNRNQHLLKDLIEVPISLAEKSLDRDGIKRIVNVDSSLTIRCNEQEIEQVFLNLISNAQYALNKKYPQACEEKRIEITAIEKKVQHEAVALLSFKDFGAGISSEALPKVFDTFYTTKELGAGTGLGLSIIENIIKSHKGKIRIDSEENEYTDVLIELPLA